MDLLVTFWVEQGFLLFISFLFVLLFSLQVYSESYQQHVLHSGSLKFKFHRLCLIASLLLLVISIDPFSLHGIFGAEVPAMLLANANVILLCTFVILDDASIEAIYHSEYKPVPTYYKVYEWFIVISSLLICNASFIVCIMESKLWFTSIFFFWTAFMLLIVCTSLLYHTWTILTVMEKLRRESVSSRVSIVSDSSDKSLMSLQVRSFMMLFVSTILIAVYVFTGYNRLMNRDAPLEQTNFNTFEWKDRLFLYVHFVVLLLMMWYSWIPFQFTPIKDDDDTTTTIKRKSSNSNNRDWRQSARATTVKVVDGVTVVASDPSSLSQGSSANSLRIRDNSES